MASRLMTTMRAGAAAFALVAAVPMIGLPLSPAAFAQSSDVLLENIAVGPIKIEKIEMTGTNATQEQVQALVTGQMPPAEAETFLKGLSAAGIEIPSVELAPPEGGSMTITGISIEELSAAEGKVASLTIGSLVAKDIPTPNGPVNVNLGETKITGVDAGAFLAELSKGMTDIEQVLSNPQNLPKFENISIAASDMSAPIDGAAAPDNILSIKLGSANMTLSNFMGNIATDAEYAINNVVLAFPAGSEPGQQLKAIGYDQLDLSLSGKGAWNKDAKTYSIEGLKFVVADGAELTISTMLGNIDETFFTGDPQTSMMAMLSAGVSEATVSFVNNGLVEKGLAFAGQMQGKTGEQLQQEAQGMAQMMLPAILGTDPGAQALATALGEFAASPKNLTVTAKAKSGMLTAQDFASVAQPADVFAKIDVTATANQ
jgi:hypothetical protein